MPDWAGARLGRCQTGLVPDRECSGAHPRRACSIIVSFPFPTQYRKLFRCLTEKGHFRSSSIFLSQTIIERCSGASLRRACSIVVSFPFPRPVPRGAPGLTEKGVFDHRLFSFPSPCVERFTTKKGVFGHRPFPFVQPSVERCSGAELRPACSIVVSFPRPDQ